MTNFRKIKDTARAKLHAGLAFAATLYSPGSSVDLKTVSVRKHTERKAAGDLAGTSLAYAESREQQPQLVFLVAEHEPARGEVYALEDGSVFQVDHVDPVDGVTRIAHCTAVSESEAGVYPYVIEGA